MDTLIEITKVISFTLGGSILEVSYLIASVLFIIGLKMLSHPDTARRGNLWAALGMSLAILATILFHRMDGEPIGNIGLIVLAIALGTLIGWLIAVKVKMTAMPQLVSFFNGMGGAAAALISLIEFQHLARLGEPVNMGSGFMLAILLGLMIGSVSFAGSMVAFGKLDGRVGDIRNPVMRYINIAFMVVLTAFVVFLMTRGSVEAGAMLPYLYLFFAIALIYGVSFVMPIGGADMPVVISLLNSFTGVAAAMGGFLYSNQAMLTGGILVGSAGTILTVLMCKAMNRSLLNVIVGAFGGGPSAAGQEDGTIREISV
ncbi:MAG TPA: NAD(P)(+) transhydrogenase (Re/Si-specific) subunit beta, partial [Bacteroidales bacterium]|nr:NAD(P)(+) transhydrogenase (Re/Si-specific) subunit beta [Bacteroidales bacterium]